MDAGGTEAAVAAVLAAIDAANALDPSREAEGGRDWPAALLYGMRMSAELAAQAPEASPLLRIAARGQHVERWLLPRSAYPEGRAGYLAWRTEQARRHARRLDGMMAAAGFPEADRERVGRLVRKEGLRRDPEVQRLEDVICLVFLRHYLAPFAARHPAEEVARILGRTARKMSAGGRARARATLDLPADWAALLAAAETG